MNKKWVTGLSMFLLAGSAAADTIGVEVGGAYWQYDISGSVRYQSSNPADTIDVNQDLGYDDDGTNFYYIAIEHPVPVLPNIRITRTEMDSSANGTLTKTFTYGGVTYSINEAVNSEVTLDQTDVTLYYQVLDNVINLDIGLDAKYIDGSARITGATSGTSRADISGWIPMLYLGAAIDMPLTGLSIEADGSAITYQSSKFYDYNLRVKYTTPWKIGIMGGYRKIKLDLDDFDESFSNLEFDGPYAGIYGKF